MTEKEPDILITEFPKKGFTIIDQLQGRVQFAILDQIELMKTSGMEYEEISKIILSNIEKILDSYRLKEN